jgi:hypothetical protein
MRKKLGKKPKLPLSKNVPSKVETVPMTATATPEVAPISLPPVISSGPPPPEILLEWAEQEPDYFELSAYTPVIHTLRRKGFSYREISEWFSKNGVDADYNAVYRAYMRNLSDRDAAMEAEREENEAREEAYRNS